MKTSIWGLGALFCCAALMLFAGCQTGPGARGFSVTPMVPGPNEEIVRDHVIVLVDVTGSIGGTRLFHHEKGLARAFTEAMPDGRYESGIDSFAGVPSRDWVRQPLAPFNREEMKRGAARIQPLGSLTPLARAIRSQRAELTGKAGRGALLVFSDGKVRIPEEVLAACRELDDVYGGELCVYTVHVGDSERGRSLMQEMAAENGCGKYYEGASLDSAAAMDALVRDVFVGIREVPAPPVAAPVPAPKPAAWKLTVINFDNDSSVVAPAYDAPLDEGAAILKENPGMRLRLEGHTDSNASDQYNQGLSERRVNAVKSTLVTRGVDGARLDTTARGEGSPVVPNDSPEHMHTNRRVELHEIK